MSPVSRSEQSRLMAPPPYTPPQPQQHMHIQPPQAFQIGPKPKSHQFLVRTFSSPLKCNHCTSLMIGLTRQGVVCEVCGFACHVHCRDRVPISCPVPPDQSKTPFCSCLECFSRKLYCALNDIFFHFFVLFAWTTSPFHQSFLPFAA